MKNQVILLPKQNYFIWVGACQNYALKFGVNLTCNPDSAGQNSNGGKVVTLVNAPGAYGLNIVAWFENMYPQIEIDLLNVTTPPELQSILDARVNAEDRFGRLQQPFLLAWPTDYAKVTQGFGANPEYYRRYGLPGHEGIDIRAPLGANVYACADGTVYRTMTAADSHPYGNQVRLQHRDGYKTIYGHLQSILVKEGDLVKTGQVIGKADSTGNSHGSHLHLTLKRSGATASRITPYPNDILDPTPFLLQPGQAEQHTSKGLRNLQGPITWAYDQCLVGVQLARRSVLTPADLQTLRLARVEAVKIPAGCKAETLLPALHQWNDQAFILVQLTADLHARTATPDEYVSWVEHDCRPYYELGERYFELNQTPNIIDAGLERNWQNGKEFADWYLAVTDMLRSKFPAAQFGFPALSPGAAIAGHRAEMWHFLQQADRAVQQADWVAVHAYWQGDNDSFDPQKGCIFQEYRKLYPQKLLFITEFANINIKTDRATKAYQYRDYYHRLRNEPGLGAAFCHVLAADSSYLNQSETWHLQDGSLSAIPSVLGKRQF
jgi:murein DD-endopeptidase MepM/ murein hydrolase activator NlpD